MKNFFVIFILFNFSLLVSSGIQELKWVELNVDKDKPTNSYDIGSGEFDGIISFRVYIKNDFPADLPIFSYGWPAWDQKIRWNLPYTIKVYNTPQSSLYMSGSYITTGLKGVKSSTYPYDWVKKSRGAVLQNIWRKTTFNNGFNDFKNKWINVAFHPRTKTLIVNGSEIVKVGSSEQVKGWAFHSEVSGYEWRYNRETGRNERYLKYPPSKQGDIIFFPDSSHISFESVNFIAPDDNQIEPAVDSNTMLKLMTFLPRINKTLDSFKLDNDFDGDGITDIDELTKHRTDPLLLDTDGDHLNDLLDPEPLSYNEDGDDDGLSNSAEIELGTNPFDVDSDKDYIFDGWEVLYGLNPMDPLDARLDPDQDGALNREEFWFGSDPLLPDTDGDGIKDGFEIGYKLNDPLSRKVAGLYPTRAEPHPSAASSSASYSYPYLFRPTTKHNQNQKNMMTVWSNNGITERFRNYFIIYPEQWYQSKELRNISLDKLRKKYYYLPDSSHNKNLVYHLWARWRTSQGNYKPLVLVPDSTEDPDNDGLSNIEEFRINTHPKISDTDNDGLSDKWEFDNEYNPLDSNDGPSGDLDGDGITNIEEFKQNLNPLDNDSDDDSIPDGKELLLGMNPLDPLDGEEDIDQDGLSNATEFLKGTNPKNLDTDGDGMNDGWEVRFLLNPLNSADALGDINQDKLTNLEEFNLNLHPGFVHKGKLIAMKDHDHDGLSNYVEIKKHQTNPKKSDSDSDSITDRDEINWGLNPLDASDAGNDFDKDGLSNYWEICISRTSPLSDDTDKDGLDDHWEFVHRQFGFDPRKLNVDGDFDNDGLSDFEEYNAGSNPTLIDTDSDGMPDNWEYSNGFALTDAIDARQDFDKDGLANLIEYTSGTSPLLPDTDNDGISDQDELENGLNPTDTLDSSLDSDEDGLNNLHEVKLGTNPLLLDTDLDGMPDGWEIDYDLNPLIDDATQDKDLDGANNLTEFTFKTNPKTKDSDGDGIDDGWEIVNGTDPRIIDSSKDLDSDNLSNFQEFTLGTSPVELDTDRDSLPDGWEVQFSINPIIFNEPNEDSDGDNLGLVLEFYHDTNPLVYDTDNDGLSDGYEINIFTNPLVSDINLDSDGDGITNIEEFKQNLNPLDNDSDDDSIPDGKELLLGMNPLDPLDGEEDIDQDGLSNATEFLKGTNPKNLDTDGDGMNDGWEVRFLLNPLNSADALGDIDKDGLVNIDEYKFSTNPTTKDSDLDGIDDKIEVTNGLDPNNSLDAKLDLDNDGLSNIDEVSNLSNITLFDSDFDGIPDLWEVNYLLKPNYYDDRDNDPDGDGLTNILEYENSTNPNSKDSDRDGIEDKQELILLLDPTDPLDSTSDLDNDGLTLIEEISLGTNYSSSDTDGDTLPDGWEFLNNSNPILPDRPNPTIKLLGSSIIYLSTGKYIELGAEALDFYDGNVSSMIKVKFPDNFAADVNGSYEITYSITNTAGQSASISRYLMVIDRTDTTPPVIVLPKEIIRFIDGGHEYFLHYRDGSLGHLLNYDHPWIADPSRVNNFRILFNDNVKQVSYSNNPSGFNIDFGSFSYKDIFEAADSELDVQLDPRPSRLLILSENGALWRMGNNKPFHAPNPVNVVENGVMSVDSCDNGYIFLKQDGSLWASGNLSRYWNEDLPSFEPIRLLENNVTQAKVLDEFIYYSLSNNEHFIKHKYGTYNIYSGFARDVVFAKTSSRYNLFLVTNNGDLLCFTKPRNGYSGDWQESKVAINVSKLLSSNFPFSYKDVDNNVFIQNPNSLDGAGDFPEIHSIVFSKQEEDLRIIGSQKINNFIPHNQYAVLSDNYIYQYKPSKGFETFFNPAPMRYIPSDKSGVAFSDKQLTTGLLESTQFISLEEFHKIFNENVSAEDDFDGNITDIIKTEVYGYLLDEKIIKYLPQTSNDLWRAYFSAIDELNLNPQLINNPEAFRPKVGVYYTNYKSIDFSGNISDRKTKWFVGRNHTDLTPQIILSLENDDWNVTDGKIFLPYDKPQTLAELDNFFKDSYEALDLEDGNITNFVRRELFTDLNYSSSGLEKPNLPELSSLGLNNFLRPFVSSSGSIKSGRGSYSMKKNEALLSYTIIDSNLNHTSVFRELSFEGADIPEIVLTGPGISEVKLGHPYIEQGSHAFDYTDGNLSKYISTDYNDLNTSRLGSYNVDYSVQDNSYFKNIFSVQRKVDVVSESISSSILNAPEWDGDIISDNIISSCFIGDDGDTLTVVENGDLYYNSESNNTSTLIMESVHHVDSCVNYSYLDDDDRWFIRKLGNPNQAIILTDDGNCFRFNGSDKTSVQIFTNCIDVACFRNYTVLLDKFGHLWALEVDKSNQSNNFGNTAIIVAEGVKEISSTNQTLLLLFNNNTISMTDSLAWVGAVYDGSVPVYGWRDPIPLNMLPLNLEINDAFYNIHSIILNNRTDNENGWGRFNQFISFKCKHENYVSLIASEVEWNNKAIDLPRGDLRKLLTEEITLSNTVRISDINNLPVIIDGVSCNRDGQFIFKSQNRLLQIDGAFRGNSEIYYPPPNNLHYSNSNEQIQARTVKFRVNTQADRHSYNITYPFMNESGEHCKIKIESTHGKTNTKIDSSYVKGTILYFEVVPDEGYVFDRWFAELNKTISPSWWWPSPISNLEGDLNNPSTWSTNKNIQPHQFYDMEYTRVPLSIQLSKDTSIKALFKPTVREFSVRPDGDPEAKFYNHDETIDNYRYYSFNHGEKLSVFASTPNRTKKFSHWSYKLEIPGKNTESGLVDKGNPFSYRLGKGLELTAHFIDRPENEEKLSGISIDYDNDWFGNAWFGDFYSSNEQNWQYHTKLGWIYSLSANQSGFWFWRENFGWVWTNNITFPHAYSDSYSDWLFFDFDKNQTKLFNFKLSSWSLLD